MSSRLQAPPAEWDDVAPGAYAALVPPGTTPMRWVSTRTLWQARRDTRARLLGDPSHGQRRRWMRGVRDEELVLDYTHLAEPTFAIMGDTGEGDGSQYAVVPALLAAAGDADALIIASDVVYPAGGVGEYAAKFHGPYAAWPHPIHAVPGNHDWYDGLRGFMLHLCGRTSRDPRGRLPREERERLAAMRPPSQRGPYWVLDTGPIRIVGIDVGITGALDRDQAAWLARVSAGRDVPKVLISGAPPYANGTHRPGAIEGGAQTVDGLVRDPRHGYVAVLSGDVHNHQRYPVEVAPGRLVHYVVCGGGGAYANGTHPIAPVDLPGVSEADVRFYPLRGDSLSYFAAGYDRWARGRGGPDRAPSTLAPDVAAALAGERHGLVPVRAGARAAEPTPADRAALARVWPRTGYRGPNRFYAEYYDTDEAPHLCSFVRLDATARTLRLRCFAATGRPEHDAAPPLEDDVTIPLA